MSSVPAGNKERQWPNQRDHRTVAACCSFSSSSSSSAKNIFRIIGRPRRQRIQHSTQRHTIDLTLSEVGVSCQLDANNCCRTIESLKCAVTSCYWPFRYGHFVTGIPPTNARLVFISIGSRVVRELSAYIVYWPLILKCRYIFHGSYTFIDGIRARSVCDHINTYGVFGEANPMWFRLHKNWAGYLQDKQWWKY